MELEQKYKHHDKCPMCDKGYLYKCTEKFFGKYVYLKCNDCGETIEY